MLTIRKAQLDAFAARSVQRFEDKMVLYLGGGAEQRRRVKEGIAQAAAWGLHDEADVRALLEWRHAFGPEFHLEKGHAEIREILDDSALAGFVKIQRIRRILEPK